MITTLWFSAAMRESLLQQSVNRITIRWISLFADIVENLVIKLENVTGCLDFLLDSSLIKLKLIANRLYWVKKMMFQSKLLYHNQISKFICLKNITNIQLPC